MEFGFGDKLAPRLGASLRRPRRRPVQGLRQLGPLLRLDQVRAVARLVRRRHLADLLPRRSTRLDVGSLNLSNMPGARPVGQCRAASATAACRTSTRPIPTSSRCTRTAPASAPSTSSAPTWSFGAHYVHNNLTRTIEDIGARRRERQRGLHHRQPRRGPGRRSSSRRARRRSASRCRSRSASTTRSSSRVNRRFSNNWFWSASYVYSRLYGNYSGLAASDEISTPTTGVTSATAQQQAGSIARQGGNANRAWDIDELFWDSHGNLDVLGRLATDRPHVVKLYGSVHDAVRHAGRRVLLRRQRHAADHLRQHGQPDARCSSTAAATWAGRRCCTRPTCSSRTSSSVGGGNKRLRFELNVLNLFNQKTTRHVFNYLNRGAGAPRASSAIISGQRRPVARATTTTR